MVLGWCPDDLAPAQRCLVRVNEYLRLYSMTADYMYVSLLQGLRILPGLGYKPI